VPSLTEALFSLGLGPRVVGITDWCVHPRAGVAGLPRMGGTKNPDRAAILALAPDLVVANREENRRRDVEALASAGLPVWVTYPRTVREAVALLGEIADLGATAEARERVVGAAERAVALAAAGTASAPAPVRVFCPIWRDPWMSIGADTYAHDLLVLCGGTNVFASLRGRRYPRVDLAQVMDAAPEVILLPDEPFAFGPRDVAELQQLAVPAAESGRIHVIDGTLVSWYGPRIARAISVLRGLLASAES